MDCVIKSTSQLLLSFIAHFSVITHYNHEQALNVHVVTLTNVTSVWSGCIGIGPATRLKETVQLALQGGRLIYTLPNFIHFLLIIHVFCYRNGSCFNNFLTYHLPPVTLHANLQTKWNRHVHKGREVYSVSVGHQTNHSVGSVWHRSVRSLISWCTW